MIILLFTVIGEDGFPINFDWSDYGCISPVVPDYYQHFCGKIPFIVDDLVSLDYNLFLLLLMI
jgi:hypothetical protein